MNWKKWVGLIGLSGFLFAIPRHACADSYQLATSSVTVYWVQVSTHVWTQVDVPQLAGRTSLEIFNVDPSSPVYCRQDNNTATLENTRPDQTQPTNTRPIPPSMYVSSSSVGGLFFANPYEGKWSLSLSNFASNRGAYPVSVSMPIWCVSAKFNVLATTVAVTQSY